MLSCLRTQHNILPACVRNVVRKGYQKSHLKIPKCGTALNDAKKQQNSLRSKYLNLRDDEYGMSYY